MRSKNFENDLRELAIKKITIEYTDIIRAVKYTEAFKFITANKEVAEYDNIIAAKSNLPQYAILKEYIQKVCKTGEKQAYNYKYYRVRNLYKDYENILVEIGSWNNLMLYIGVCSIADKFEDEREIIEPLMEYLISLISLHNKIGIYKDVILACFDENVSHCIADILYEVSYERNRE